MVAKRYKWAEGATLEDHSRRKHKILREYFYQYLVVRCQIPQQAKFRLAVIDGFAGGGRYKCGAAGSPVIFIEELKNAVNAVNLDRLAQGLGAIEIECLLLLNDESAEAVEALKANVAPLMADIKENCISRSNFWTMRSRPLTRLSSNTSPKVATVASYSISTNAGIAMSLTRQSSI